MTENKPRDNIYADEKPVVKAFAFDDAVAEVFEDMIQRSVPGYGVLLEMIGLVANRFAKPGTRCYDLGCSLGASTLQIRENIPASCHVIGVDKSPSMTRRCQADLSASTSRTGASTEVRLEDIRDTIIENASVVVLNFTLQFLPDDEREGLLARIWQGLISGGALLLSEKLAFTDGAEDELMTELHLAFKRANGYSDLEIAQKRMALEKVLVPNTLEEHLRRLGAAGFSTVSPFARALNFAGIVAVK